MEYIINRLKEASTWAGIAIFFGMFGIDASIIERITANGPAMITAVASIVAIIVPNVIGKAKNNPTTDHGTTAAKSPIHNPTHDRGLIG